MCHTDNKKRKRETTEGIKLSIKNSIRMLEGKENFLKILEADGIRTGKLLKTKLYRRNLIKGINTWAVTLVRHSCPFKSPKDKEIDDDAQDLTSERQHRQTL